MNTKPREPRHCQKWFMHHRMKLLSLLNFDGYRSLFINIYPSLTHILRGEGMYICIRVRREMAIGILAKGRTSACGGPQTLRLLGRPANFYHTNGITARLSLCPAGVTKKTKKYVNVNNHVNDIYQTIKTIIFTGSLLFVT